MKKSKHNAIFYILFLVIGLGLLCEIIGGVYLSPPIDIGINTNISPLTYLGFGLVTLGLLGYIVICVIAKKLSFNKTLKDVLMLISVLAFLAAILILAGVIVWPAIFPQNG